MNLVAVFLLPFLLSLLFTTFLFSISLRKRNNSIMDIGYGLCFIFTATILSYMALIGGHFSVTSMIMLLLIGLWGARLSFRIYRRNKGKEEDFRYAIWRNTWSRKGKLYFLVRSYFQIFVLQAFVVSAVILPFTLSVMGLEKKNLTLIGAFGILLWCIGFFFEAVGDAELDSFLAKRNKHGAQFLTTGLFSLTRHPNYFGESMMWFGLSVLGFSASSSYLSFLSPILITSLLLFVSGIPLVEKRWHGNPEWEEYAKRTRGFLPFPK